MKPQTPPPESILESAIEANAVRAHLHKHKKQVLKGIKIQNRQKMRKIGYRNLPPSLKGITPGPIDRAHDLAIRMDKAITRMSQPRTESLNPPASTLPSTGETI